MLGMAFQLRRNKKRRDTEEKLLWPPSKVTLISDRVQISCPCATSSARWVEIGQ
jgi:hypothetical protein